MRSTLLSLVLVSGTALADPSGNKWFSTNPGVPYRVFQHAQINGVANFQTTALPIIQNAFANWTGARLTCTNWSSTYSGTFTTPTGTAAVSGSDGKNSVIWLGGANWRYSTSTLGLTTAFFYQGTGQIFDADMEMNDNVVWSTTGAPSAYDVESIAVHEAGHFLGLAHTPSAFDAVMYPSIGPGTLKRTLAAADRTDVCQLYPSAGTGGAQGTACTQDAGCATGLVCRGPPASASKICASACAGQGAACPTGYTCQQANTGWACLVPVGSPDLCRFCTSGTQCSSGLCVTDGRHNWCTLPCSSPATCGTGYSCLPGGASNVCVPTAGRCPSQCTAATQCTAGYTCASGTCEATGRVGDRCELSGYCEACAICIGTLSSAICRGCCGGTGGGGRCASCTNPTCTTGFACEQVTGSNDRVCVPSSGALQCQPCGASTPCAQGQCFAGRCHDTCNVTNPEPCSACYDSGGGIGYCACIDEVALAGEPCGPVAGGSFAACVTGLACVGSPSVCRKTCTIGSGSSCASGEVCAQVSGRSVCVPGSTQGERCQTCNGTSCAGSLTCFQGRCYEPCQLSSPSCGSCVEVQTGLALCACDGQRGGLNEPCGLVPPSLVVSCGYGLSCQCGACRLDCNPTNPLCAAGTSCVTVTSGSYCLPSGCGGAGGGTGGGAAGGAGGAPGGSGGSDGSSTNHGCGCGSLAASTSWALVGLLLLRRRRWTA